jgi:hypothetical protein
LDVIRKAAAKLGVFPLYLADEILAVVRRDDPRYARHGIDVLIQQRSWLKLARRLCVDRALLPFAFHGLGEVTYQDDYRVVIDELQKTYFESISEGDLGELRDFEPKKPSKALLVANSTTDPRPTFRGAGQPEGEASEEADEGQSGESDAEESSSDVM